MGVYRPVRALERGLAVLKAANTLTRPTVEAIARETGLPWSTTLRLLETLEEHGYVKRSIDRHIFRPTLEARSLGQGFDREGLVTEFASQRAGELSRAILWPVDILVFDNDTMLIVESTQSTSPFSVDRNMIGRRFSVLRSSAGLAYVAHVSETERREIIERLTFKNDAEGALARDARQLGTLIARTRKNGYGSRDRGFPHHTKSISAPIVTGERVLGCISIIWIASALTMAEATRRYADELKQAAADIAANVEGMR